MRKKKSYEDDPWREDPPGKLTRVADDFLPSPSEIRNMRVRIFNAEDVSVRFKVDELKSLDKKAKKVGLTAEGLLAGVVQDYMDGKLVRRD